MSFLTLVRHGQATGLQEQPDRLTETGQLQVRRLAEFWLKNDIYFHEVYTGTLFRQMRTEQIVAEAYAQAGVSWPAAQATHGFNEYDATGILGALAPALAARDPRVAGLVEAFETALGTPEQNRMFQRMFEVVMSAWARGEAPLNGVEQWPAFRARVSEALQRVIHGSANRRIAVFTSGGPIGLSVQTAMRAPDQAFLEVNWRVRNCSLTEFVFSGDRFTLDSFNGVPHLDDMTLWTYR